MRPDSIRKFDLFYLASIFISIASTLMNFDTQVAALDVRLAELGVVYPAEAFLLITLAFSFAINVLLWFLASRLRLGFVKWIILALVLYSAITMAAGLSMGIGSISITALLNLVLKAIAVSFLFRTDAKEWFATRGK
ncbi:hypothetical protein [Erythrobacter alti]|uniref:hypothetical protein n=1 Tax=Erythrobacter alti TaxID=1896145 RepID=UPI0030F451F3